MAENQQFTISYYATCYFDVTVERPADISKEELLSSITRDELCTAERTGDGDDLRQAVRKQQVSLILDEEFEEAFPN